MERIEKLQKLIDRLFSMEIERKENLKRLRELFYRLKIDEKVASFEDLFSYNAINVTGISLQKEQLLQIQPKRYLQIIGIKRTDNRSKNINLKYFGKVENIEENTLAEVAEFVLRWRLEKGYLAVLGYRELLDELRKKVG